MGGQEGLWPHWVREIWLRIPRRVIALGILSCLCRSTLPCHEHNRCFNRCFNSPRRLFPELHRVRQIDSLIQLKGRQTTAHTTGRPPYGCGSRIGTKNRTPVNGNKDSNLRFISWWFNFDPYPYAAIDLYICCQRARFLTAWLQTQSRFVCLPKCPKPGQ